MCHSKLKAGVSKSSHISGLLSSTSGSELAYTYDDTFQGYSVQLGGTALDYIRQSKDVEYIVQDEVVKLQDR
jgi:cerevisin